MGGVQKAAGTTEGCANSLPSMHTIAAGYSAGHAPLLLQNATPHRQQNIHKHRTHCSTVISRSTKLSVSNIPACLEPHRAVLTPCPCCPSQAVPPPQHGVPLSHHALLPLLLSQQQAVVGHQLAPDRVTGHLQKGCGWADRSCLLVLGLGLGL